MARIKALSIGIAAMGMGFAGAAGPLAAATLQRDAQDCVIACASDTDPLVLPGLDEFGPITEDMQPPRFSRENDAFRPVDTTPAKTSVLPFLDQEDDRQHRPDPAPDGLFNSTPLRLIPSNRP